MSHMVETMCADGITWHTSLTNHAICDGVQTAKEMFELAGLNWSVSQQKVYLKDGSEVPGYVANTRDSDNVVMGIVSDQYSVVQNYQAFEFVDSIIGSGEAKFNTAGCLYNKYNRPTRIWVSAKLKPMTIMGDQVDNYLVFNHSHDGLNAVKAFVTPVRVVCHNTLTLATDNTKRSWSTQHKGDIKSKLEAAQLTLKLYEDYISEVPAMAEKLNSINLYPEDIAYLMDAIFPLPPEDGRAYTNMNSLRTDILKCYNMKDDLARFKNTAWGLYQAVVDVIEHKSILRNTETAEFNRQFKIIEGIPQLGKLQKMLLEVKA